LSSVLSSEFDDLARFYESGGYLSIVPLCYVLYGEVRCDDGWESLLVSVVDSYKELLSDPVGPFFLVDIIDDKQASASEPCQEVFPGSVEFVIEGVLHHRESRGPVDHEAIHPVSSNEFIGHDRSGRRLSCSDISPEVESFGPVLFEFIDVVFYDRQKARIFRQGCDSEIAKLWGDSSSRLGIQEVLRISAHDLGFGLWEREPLFIHCFSDVAPLTKCFG